MQTLPISISIFASTLLTLTSCTTDSVVDDELDDAIAEADANEQLPPTVIAGGTLAGGANLSAGYLAYGGLQQCSGVLIRPTVFLTAAHCVRALKQSGATTFHVGFGDYNQRYRVRGTQAIRHPSWNGSVASPYDVGIIVMASPLAGVPVARIQTGGVVIGAIREIVGYGLRYDGDPGTVSVRKKALVTITTKGPTFQSVAVTGVGCPGDSGGGVFINESNSLIGLHSASSAAGCNIALTNVAVNLNAYVKPWLTSIGATYL
jgi:V8-like Glu-specific endopeptidase